LQAVQANPELVEMMQQYLDQKEQQARDQQIAEEAQSNIRRQQIERGVERDSGMEPQKLVDQVGESLKREAIKPVLEEAAMRHAGIPQQVPEQPDQQR
jgi:hypothetical protein